jgi:hypothetical protein
VNAGILGFSLAIPDYCPEQQYLYGQDSGGSERRRRRMVQRRMAEEYTGEYIQRRIVGDGILPEPVLLSQRRPQ